MSRSSRQELKVAKEIQGRRHIASGALWFDKGDVENDYFVGEVKYTDAPFYTLKTSTIDKVDREAKKKGKNWFIRVDFKNVKICVFPRGFKFGKIRLSKSRVINKSLRLNSKEFEDGEWFTLLRICDKQDYYYIVTWDMAVDKIEGLTNA